MASDGKFFKAIEAAVLKGLPTTQRLYAFFSVEIILNDTYARLV